MPEEASIRISLPASVELYDSTLRDGVQAEGISLSVEDKLSIARLLDEIGVHYIEAGNPASNPKDAEHFRFLSERTFSRSQVVAFGATRRRDVSAQEDEGLQALLSANTDVCCVFGKSWRLHITRILGVTEEENRAMIADSVGFLRAHGRRVFFDAEHFFDGWRDDPECALGAVSAAVGAGAECVVLCDTRGAAFPGEIREATRAVRRRFPDVTLGIHCHDDCGMAVAGSIAAVEAGATQVHGTWLGFGERCGNANLATIAANLQLHRGVNCLPEESLSRLTPLSRELAEICNLRLPRAMPYTGSSAFAHKAGMHADGVLKFAPSFEHVSPECVGNERRILMSEQTGRAAVLARVRRLFPELDSSSEQVAKILDRLKQLEFEGYQFEGAEPSFELLARRTLGLYQPHFELVSYKVLDEEPVDQSGVSSTATLKIRVGGELCVVAAQGDGPVNALDLALREALSRFYRRLLKCRLIDYKVRVMDSSRATAAFVRVLITSTDGNEVWSTVGVSYDVIRASWLALVDSFEYRLIRDGTPALGGKEAE